MVSFSKENNLIWTNWDISSLKKTGEGIDTFLIKKIFGDLIYIITKFWNFYFFLLLLLT